MKAIVPIRCAVLLVLAGLALLGPGAAEVWAQDRSVLAETGRKLWDSRRIVGPGGETCGSCHDSYDGTPLDGASLRGKRGHLENLVFFELVTRSGNRMVQLDGSEVAALTAHLIDRYRLDEELPAPQVAEAPGAAEDPSVAEEPTQLEREQLALALRHYSEGLLEPAVTLLSQSLESGLSRPAAVEAHTLLGCVYQVLGRESLVVEQFTAALRLDPEAQIDAETFSPKTVELFESLRQAVIGGG